MLHCFKTLDNACLYNLNLIQDMPFQSYKIVYSYITKHKKNTVKETKYWALLEKKNNLIFNCFKHSQSRIGMSVCVNFENHTIECKPIYFVWTLQHTVFFSYILLKTYLMKIFCFPNSLRHKAYQLKNHIHFILLVYLQSITTVEDTCINP